jgi:hypothetical protein
MAGQSACSLGTKSTAELCENMQGAFRASVFDLSRPKRNELRQIALAHIAAGAGVGHAGKNSRGG